MPTPTRRSTRLALMGLLFGCESPGPEPEPTMSVAYVADEEVGALMSVWGPAPEELLAVGGQPTREGTPGRGVMLAFDGEDWSPLALPEGVPMLNWVHGVQGRVLAVGEAGTILQRDSGGAFSRTPMVPTDQPLWGVWSSAPGRGWAVGGDPFGDAPVLLRHDEDADPAWTSVPLPELDRPSAALFKVWGRDADAVWAVGDAGVILHYDGTGWRQQASGTGADLISLWGRELDEGFALTAIGGRSNARVLRWAGGAWEEEALASLPGMNGVWMNADGRALIGGIQGTLAWVEPDGSFAPLEAALAPQVVHAVFGFDGGPHFAVGGSLDRSPPYTGFIAWDGGEGG